MHSPLPFFVALQDAFLVLGCDGVWDKMTLTNVVDFVSQSLVEEVRVWRL